MTDYGELGEKLVDDLQQYEVNESNEQTKSLIGAIKYHALIGAASRAAQADDIVKALEAVRETIIDLTIVLEQE